MNYRWMTAGAIAVLTLIVGGFSYFCFYQPIAEAQGEAGDLAWVEHEFKLGGEKLARVEAMHEAYRGICAEHCRLIAEAREELRDLQAKGAAPEQIAAATAKVSAAQAECLTRTREHIRQVAAVIGGAQGQRYLAIVLPRVETFDHGAPATLDMNNNAAHDHLDTHH